VAFLLVREKNNVIDKIPLYKDLFLIGRALENDLILTDTASSRKHSRIVKNPNGFHIEDMASANGTMVNGSIIREKHNLKDGDVVKIGDTELVFRDEEKPSKPAPGAPPGQGGQLKNLGTSQIIKPVRDITPDLEKSIADLSLSIVQERQMVKAPGAKPVVEKAKDTNFQILYQLGKILTTTSTLDQLLETGMRLVMEVLRADRGVMKIIDPKTGQLVTKATRVKGELQRFAGNIEISSTISNKVVEEKVSIMTADARNDPRFLQGQSIVAINIRGALCVPLWDEENVRGIIYVDNLMETNTFTESDLDLLTAVAHQIAIGLKKEELNNKIRREAVVRSNLERFHSPEELEMILKHGDKGFSMRETDASVLFSDIVSFTPMSETMKPTEVADMLNMYFSTMTKIIFKNKGSVNKYIGDGIMATFGAISDTDNGAENAVRAGCEMIMALKELHKSPELKQKFRIRIGVNTGPVVVGMLGPVERMEFTVLGDTVNLAARFESGGRPMGVCFGERTFKECGHKFRVQELGQTQLKGKALPIKLFGILLDNV
jgi:adenylate cyclase